MKRLVSPKKILFLSIVIIAALGVLCFAFILDPVLRRVTSYTTSGVFTTSLLWYSLPHTDSGIMTHVQQRQGQYWVGLDATLIERVQIYNKVLSMIRTQAHLANSKTSATWPNNTQKFYSNDATYLNELARNASDTTTTVLLEYVGPLIDRQWDSRLPQVRNNYLVANYYDFDGDSPLCQWLDKRRWPILRASKCVERERAGYVRSSVVNINKPSSLSAYSVRYQMVGSEDRPYLTSIHIVRWGTVTNTGQVFCVDYEIIPAELYDNPGTLYESPTFNVSRLHEEVFVISQYYGSDYYHLKMENMPRLAAHLPFLRQHPTIRIHVVGGRSQLLEGLFGALGLDPARIISGIVHANIVYLPRSTRANGVRTTEGQLLSFEYRSHVESVVTYTSDDKAWSSVVLIKRTTKRGRHFSQQNAIESVVRNITESFGLRYELFSDDPPPSVEQTMLMFYRARVIIGPHGAGLSNMIYSRPGTYVIEGITDFPATVTCYVYSAYHLGHIYYGLPSKGGYPKLIKVEWQDIARVLNSILTQMSLT